MTPILVPKISAWRAVAIAWHFSDPTPEEHLALELENARLKKLLHERDQEYHKSQVQMYEDRIKRLEKRFMDAVKTRQQMAAAIEAESVLKVASESRTAARRISVSSEKG